MTKTAQHISSVGKITFVEVVEINYPVITFKRVSDGEVYTITNETTIVEHAETTIYQD